MIKTVPLTGGRISCRTEARRRGRDHPVWSITHGPTTSLYCEDADGVRLEFQVEMLTT